MTAKPRRKTSKAPKGRNNSAQGNALGNAAHDSPPEAQSPKGAKQTSPGQRLGFHAPYGLSPEGAGQSSDLLARVLSERRTTWRGRGQYKEPVAAETANLPHLPDDWVWASLDQLFLNITDGDHLPPPQTSAGVPFVVIGDVRSGKLDLSDTRFVAREYADAVDAFRKPKKGDILYTLVGSFGLAVRVTTDDEFCIQRHIAVLRPHSLSPADYLAHVLNSPTVFRHASSVATGTAQKTVPLAGLRRIPVPLPPLDDQRRIVAEIEKQFTRLEAGVAALRRVQANLKRYRAAVLKAACEGRLVPTEAELARAEGRPFESGQQLLARILTERRQNWQGRGKYKEPDAPATTTLPELPTGWTWATVEQLAAPELNSITDGPFGSNLKTEHYTSSGPRVIRLQNIGDGVYVDEEAHITQEHFERLKKHRVFANDVVIAGFGENPPRSCVIPESLGPAIVKADCIRFKPHSDVLPRYMNAALNSDPVRKRTKGMVHGVGRPRLNLGEIKSIVLPLPPLAEQTRIVAEVERRLSVVEELEAVVTTNLQRATRLRQAVLQKAFSGQISPG